VNAATFRDQAFAITSEEGATSVRGVKSSAEFFDVLGIKPIIGRTFTRDDEQTGGGPGGFKVMLSYDTWQKRFGGDQNVLGRSVELDRRQYTIIGVLPQGFQFPIQAEPLDFYVTIAGDATTCRWVAAADAAARQPQHGRHCAPKVRCQHRAGTGGSLDHRREPRAAVSRDELELWRRPPTAARGVDR
jgi:hypothetical protein